MKKEIVGLIVLVSILLVSSFVFAEVIKLKSGKTIEGKILDKTDKFIKIDFSGVPLTYYFDEIESINGEKMQRANADIKPPDIVSKKNNNSGADKWDEFSKFMDQFYYLDKQNFNNISCDISVPFIDNMLTSIESQLKPFEKNLKIEENLDKFSLNFNRETGLTFNLPKFDIKIISEQGMANPAQVKMGIDQMRNGFNQQVKGITGIIRGVFEAYISPQKDDYAIIKFSQNGEETRIVYRKEGANITETYRGAICDSIQSGQYSEIRSREEYKRIDNKLILSNANAYIDQAAGTINSNIKVEYQKIGAIYFPSSIISETVMSMGGMKGEIPIEIIFKNCKVN